MTSHTERPVPSLAATRTVRYSALGASGAFHECRERPLQNVLDVGLCGWNLEVV
jgi:hypothetical protein